MALFGKKRIAIDSSPRPIEISDEDLERARRTLSYFEDVCGANRDIKSAALSVATAGGAPDVVEATEIYATTGENVYERPWRWLAAITSEANRRDDLELVAHVSLFAFYWSTTPQLQNLSLADSMDMRLGSGGASPAILAEIYATALDALPAMDPDAAVWETPSATMTANMLLCGCAGDVLTRENLGEELTEIAHQILGR